MLLQRSFSYVVSLCIYFQADASAVDGGRSSVFFPGARYGVYISADPSAPRCLADASWSSPNWEVLKEKHIQCRHVQNIGSFACEQLGS